MQDNIRSSVDEFRRAETRERWIAMDSEHLSWEMLTSHQKFMIPKVCIYGNVVANMSFVLNLFLDCFFFARYDDFNYAIKRAETQENISVTSKKKMNN